MAEHGITHSQHGAGNLLLAGLQLPQRRFLMLLDALLQQVGRGSSQGLPGLQQGLSLLRGSWPQRGQSAKQIAAEQLDRRRFLLTTPRHCTQRTLQIGGIVDAPLLLQGADQLCRRLHRHALPLGEPGRHRQHRVHIAERHLALGHRLRQVQHLFAGHRSSIRRHHNALAQCRLGDRVVGLPCRFANLHQTPTKREARAQGRSRDITDRVQLGQRLCRRFHSLPIVRRCARRWRYTDGDFRQANLCRPQPQQIDDPSQRQPGFPRVALTGAMADILIVQNGIDAIHQRAHGQTCIQFSNEGSQAHGGVRYHPAERAAQTDDSRHQHVRLFTHFHFTRPLTTFVTSTTRERRSPDAPRGRTSPPRPPATNAGR